jgi:hypothetical protein
VLTEFRTRFDQHQFTPQRYELLQQRLAARIGTPIDFRICETPCFFQKSLLDEIVEAGRVLTHQLIDNPDYMRVSDQTIPSQFHVPAPSPRPHFMTVDFGLVRNASGALEPKLVELQAFPSVFGYQQYLCEEYRTVYDLDEQLAWNLGGMDTAAYWEALGRTILGTCAPENVVLTEVEPETQKTLPDFAVYQQQFGIQTVDIAKVRQTGNHLEYLREIPGKSPIWTPIHRIYNRAIVDEIQRKHITPGFDYRDDLDVEWAGSPNWFFRISKFSLPFLDHPSVPKAVFLSDWFAGKRDGLPDDRAQLLLKPLYSFAGKGIQFAPTDDDLAVIPPDERQFYLLQERVYFESVIDTPAGLTQAEIRVMYCWPDYSFDMIPMICLVRLGRGLMMGVDHNRHQLYVGGSAALFPV